MEYEYDPDVAPDAERWLALDEGERIALAQAAHEPEGEPVDAGERPLLHYTIHALVEAQIAEDVPGTRATIDRFVRSGVPRHDAVHAVGSVIAEQMHTILTTNDRFDPDDYRARLEALDPKVWKPG